MGYDFLGTMNLNQWAKIRDFTNNSLKEMAADVATTTAYERHLQAEQIKAARTLEQLEVAATVFNNFMGDFPLDKEVQPKFPSYRMNYDDGMAGVFVSKIKDFQLAALKRQKDNIEYRIKKYWDLEDQYSNRLTTLNVLSDNAAKWMSSIEQMFSNPLYRHNLTQVMDSPTEYTNHIESSTAVIYKDTPMASIPDGIREAQRQQESSGNGRA